MQKFLVIGLMLAVSPVLSLAADQAQQNNSNNSSVPMMLQQTAIKSMIDIVSRQVSRRYDLRPDQSETAKTMLEKNTLEFVNKHYNEFIVLIPQAQAMRMRVMAGEEPSAQEVKELSAKLLPIYKEATDLIVSENVKFANVLDEKQKAKHQADMDRMKADVAETTQKLDRWKKGDYKPGEFLNNRKNRNNRNGPAANEQAQNVQEENLTPTSLGFWELYVKTFIDAFQLEKGQVTLAWSVLNDLKVKAQAYRHDHEEEFMDLTQKVEQLTQAKADAKRDENLKNTQEKLDKLNQPLMAMFDELKERLMAIPTQAQRKAAQETLGPDQVQATQAAASTQPAAEKK
jgi:hypothetical protein